MSLEIVTLSDAASGATARVLPELGFNCYSFQVPTDGDPYEVLWAEDGVTAGAARPSGSGIPILFPFAGRIRGGRYEFEGRRFELEHGDGRGNAIHGFVLDRPWEVVQQSDSRVRGRFQASRVDEALLDRWPCDFALTVDYEVRGTTLSCRMLVENPGEGALPFGLGTHPYFRLPLGPGGNADACRIHVPTGKYWELVDLLPTGQKLAATGPRGLDDGLTFADAALDDVFTDLSASQGHVEARIVDPAAGRTLVMRFEDTLRECVVYTPPHREAICIEPYSCVPDAFWLREQGAQTGLRILKPGETFETMIEITIEITIE
jgi:aldose 1-epimerase